MKKYYKSYVTYKLIITDVVKSDMVDLEQLLETIVDSIQRYLNIYISDNDICFKILSFVHNISFNNNMLQKVVARMNYSTEGCRGIIEYIIITFSNPLFSPKIYDQGLCSLQNMTCENGK